MISISIFIIRAPEHLTVRSKGKILESRMWDKYIIHPQTYRQTQDTNERSGTVKKTL